MARSRGETYPILSTIGHLRVLSDKNSSEEVCNTAIKELEWICRKSHHSKKRIRLNAPFVSEHPQNWFNEEAQENLRLSIGHLEEIVCLTSQIKEEFPAIAENILHYGIVKRGVNALNEKQRLNDTDHLKR